VTIWYHQHMDLVWAWGPSTAAGRSYARAAGMRFYHHAWLRGTAPNWQNHHLPGSSSFVVELPAGSLSVDQVRRQQRGVLRLANEARSHLTGNRNVGPRSCRSHRRSYLLQPLRRYVRGCPRGPTRLSSVATVT
jgi:hypothetical protein